MRPKLSTTLLAVLLCLATPSTWASNPNTPPGGKPNGDAKGSSDETQDPSNEYPENGTGSEGNSNTSGNGSGTSGGKKDCDGTNSSSDPNASGGKDCCKKPTTDPTPPSCVRETVALAFAPNDNGLGSGVLQLYIDTTAGNLGSRTFLDFYGIPWMNATKLPNAGTSSVYRISQAGGSFITFAIDDSQVPGPSGYMVGYPVGGEAYSQARITYVDVAGAPTNKAGAVYLRQHRAGSGHVDYPVAGGRAVKFVTTEGRPYTFPFAGVEFIAERPNGTYVDNAFQSNDVIRQLKTHAGLLDVVPLTDRSYEIRKYAPQQVGTRPPWGLYPVTGSPYFTMKVEAPVATLNTLVITKTSGTQQTVTTYVCTADPLTGETWKQTVQKGGFTYERVLARSPQVGLGPDYRSSTWTARLLAAPGMTIPANPPADYQIESTTYKYAPLSSLQTYKSGASYSRTRTFAAPSWDVNGVGRETAQTKSSGTQMGYDIDPATQRMLSRTWTVTVPAGGGSAPTERKEEFDYDPVAPGEMVLPFDFRPRITARLQDGVLTSRTFFSFRTDAGEYVQTTEEAATLAAAWGDANSRRTERRYYGSGVNQGRLKEVRHEDGTLTRYDYAAQSGGQLLVTTTSQLTPAGAALNGHSTRTKELRDVRGWVLETTRAHWVAGAWLDYETIFQTYDVQGKLTSRTRKDLLTNQQRILLEQEWDGEVVVQRVDERGLSTLHEYFPGTDILKKTTREAIPATGGHAAQPEIVTTLSGTFTLRESQTPEWDQKVETTTADGLTLTRTTVYDDQGRAVSQIDENGYTTVTAYNATGTVITTTLPSGGTKISAATSEGQLLRTTGTAVVAAYHHYSPLVAGGTSKTTYSGTDSGPRWMTTEYDAAHRIARVLQPAFGGATSETLYNYQNGCPCGKPSLVTTNGRPATVNQYNAVNDLVRTGLTGDNLTLELNSTTDRIQETDTTVELASGLLWEVQRSAVYDQAGSATPKTVATSRRLLAGFTGSETSISESIDIAGNTTRTVTELNRTTHIETSEQVRPGASDAQTRTTFAGRTVTAHQPGSSGDVVYTHDALGRVIETQHPGHAHAESTDYVVGTNLVASNSDATGATTAYTYVPQGQAGAGLMESTTAPDTGVTTNQYDLLGRVTRTSGARVYPVGYTYNLYGQMETMTTWQDYAGLTGAAVTTWGYESATGLLTSKTDAASQAVTYTYDVAGRLTSRTWARGVVTTYGYDPTMADLATVEYSDATPAVDYSYDRLGRPTVITTDLVAQTEFTYRTDNLLPDTEVVQQDLDGNGTVDFQRTFVRQYDALLRSTGYLLESAPTVTEQSLTYGYETVAGRYSSVAAQTLSGPVNTFTYGYDAARPGLLSTVVGPAHTVTNTWEADRDILNTKTNTATVSGSTVVSSFDYAVNNIGQRTGVAATGTAFAASSGWAWGYDSLGQVTSATHTGNTALNQGYDYDDIGNRTQSSVGLSSPAVTSYTANMLNQYSAITGASAPAVSPSYDADGNQLAGAAGQALGQTFEWDGENRLKVVKDSLGNVLVTYAYDANSRRIRRTTSSGSTLYVYDGWNCVGEHTVPASSTTATLSRTLAWGLDLSDSLQGAGGVGGLLNVVDIGAAIVYPAYDGNGNVSEYLDAAGAVVAHFEYDAFGRVIVVSGSATGLDIRFSTKPQDNVTGWYYYGYRFYDGVAGRWASRDPIEENGGINLCGMLQNDLANKVDIWGLRQCPCGANVGEENVTDDAGEICCNDEIREVSLKSDHSGGKTDVGHTWIDTPSGSWGFYPKKPPTKREAIDDWEGGNHKSRPGDVKSPDLHEKKHDKAGTSPSAEKKYKACPATYDKLMDSISSNKKGDWSISNYPTENCVGWACKRLEDAGFKPPVPSWQFKARPDNIK
jgi:RHS repeat-associated protein